MRDFLRRLAIGLGMALLVLLLWRMDAFEWLHLRALDLAFSMRPPPPPSCDVVVVGIDSESLKALGGLPLPRSCYATAIRMLSEAGAESIALDMWFTEPSGDAGQDDALREAARRAGNVLVALHVARQEANVKVTRSRPKLVGRVMHEAHVNVTQDSDGRVRRVPWEVHTLAERFLFLPIALAARHFGVDPEEVRPEQGTLRLGPVRLPLEEMKDGSGTFLLDLPMTRTEENYISFHRLVQGNVKPEQVRGKIVLIGQVIVGGGYADVWDTVRGRKFGVTMLSEIVQQLLDGRVLSAAPGAWTVFLVLMLSLSGAFLFYPRHGLLGFAAHLFLLWVIWFFFLFLMARYGRIVEPVPLTAAVLGSLTAGIVLSLRRAGHELVQDARAMDLLREVGETVVSSMGVPTIVTGKRPDVSQSLLLPGQTPRVLLETIAQAVGAQRGALFVARQGRPGMVCIASLGRYDAIAPAFVDQVNERLLQGVRGFTTCAPSRSLGLRSPQHPAVLLAIPLSFKGRVTGAIHLCDKRATEISPGRRFAPADLRLVAIMAQQTMIGLENASLYEGMRDIFMRATLALANAVDAKDPYTHGHSERVVSYSERLARAMKLSPQDIETIKTAAVLHDIGKIAIPDEILRKPGKLTDEEFDLIQTHSARGEAILAPLEELQPLRPAIRHHHERYDGKGYPDQLAGADIPLYARILCVADSFDAIISQRYYHEAKSLEEGLKVIRACSGSQFDPEIAACFIQTLSAYAHGPLLPQEASPALAT